MSKYDEAKKIYFYYNGNFFFMDREGDYEKYQAFNVPKTIEKEWTEELKDNYKKSIENEKNMQKFELSCNALIRISSNTINGLADINSLLFVYNIFMERRDCLDTYTIVKMIGVFFDDVGVKNFKKVSIITTARILKETLEFLKSLLDKPITISKDHEFFLKKPTNNDLKTQIRDDIQEYTKIYDQTVLDMLNANMKREITT